MADDRGSWVPRYLLAIGVTGITTGLMQAVELSTAEMMCSSYLFAVIVTAWFAGLGPAVLAAGLSCAAMDYVFRVHRSSVMLTDMVGLLVFAAVSILVAWLTVGRRQAQRARQAHLVESERGRRDAEAANRAKDEFLAILGDQMRTPMAAMASAASVLTRLVRDDRDLRQASDVITREIDHLWRLVEDLLDIGRIARGTMVLYRWPMDLAEVVRRCIEHVNAAGRTADHDVIYAGESVWVDADSLRIAQVVDMLLVNALTYTPAGGRVKVSVSMNNRDAILRVEDGGSALDAGSLPFVFDVFYQARQGLDRPGEGLGMGLNLVKRLVELHGGTVSVASPGLQQGRTFTIRFPRTAPVGPSQKPVPVLGREDMQHRHRVEK